MNVKKKKGFWRSYVQSIASSVLLAAFVVYPYFAMQFNPPPPESSAQILRGEIVNAQRQFPHVLLRLSDGTEQYLSFLGSLQTVYAAKYPDFYGASKEDLALLNGFAAEVKIDHLKGLVVPSSPEFGAFNARNFLSATTSFPSIT